MKTFNCPNCNASLSFDNDREFGFCQYCGTKVMLDDYRSVHRYVDEARIKEAEANKAIRLKELELEEKKREQQRKSKKVKHIFILGFVLFFIIAFIIESNSMSDAEKVEWDNIILGDIIPKPTSDIMEVHTNDEKRLSIYVHDMSQNDYLTYVRNSREEKEFTIDTQDYGSSFYGYNQQGYYLDLFYDEFEDEMHISLEVPMPMIEYELPAFADNAGLPLPESELGSYHWENSDSFFLYVGNTTVEDYKLYKKECVNAGFTIEPYEGETFYSATNEDGYKLSIGYEGFNRIKIELHCPDVTPKS